jgi:hypothetical protein
MSVPGEQINALNPLPSALTGAERIPIDQNNGSGFTTYYGTPAQLGGIVPRTAAEIAVGVMPVNFLYSEGYLLRYGNNVNPGTTDMTAALNNATAVCAYGKAALQLPPGNILVTYWDCVAKYTGPFAYPRNTNGGLSVFGNGIVLSNIIIVNGLNNSGIGWDTSGVSFGYFENFSVQGGTSVTNCPKTTFLQGALNVGGAFVPSLNCVWKNVAFKGYGDYIWYNNGAEQQDFDNCTLISNRNYLFPNCQPITFVSQGSTSQVTSSIGTSYSPCQSMTDVHWHGADAYIGVAGNYGILFHFSDSGTRACADIRFDDYAQILTPIATATGCTISASTLTVAGTVAGVILEGATVNYAGNAYGVILSQSSGLPGAGGVYVISGSGSVAGSMSFTPAAPFKWMTDDSSASTTVGAGLFNCGGERMILEPAGGYGNIQVCDFGVELPKGIKFHGHTGSSEAITANPCVFESTATPTNIDVNWDPNESGSWSGAYLVQCFGSGNGISVRGPVPSANLVSVATANTVDSFSATTFVGQGNDFAQLLGTHLVEGSATTGVFNRTRKVRAGPFTSALSDWNEGVEVAAAVTTSAVQILQIPNWANLVAVLGEDAGGDKFGDLLWVGFSTVATIASMTLSGSPSARTYSNSSNLLTLAMASGTYAVQCSVQGFGMQV